MATCVMQLFFSRVFFCHVGFIITRVSIKIVSAMSDSSQYSSLFCYEIFEIYKNGKKCKIETQSLDSTVNSLLYSVTYPSICLSSLHPSIQFFFPFMHKRTLNPQMFQHDIINESSILVTKLCLFIFFMYKTKLFYLIVYCLPPWLNISSMRGASSMLILFTGISLTPKLLPGSQ